MLKIFKILLVLFFFWFLFLSSISVMDVLLVV